MSFATVRSAASQGKMDPTSCWLTPVALGNWDAPADAEGARRDFESGRGLAAFVFAESDLVDDVANDVGVEAVVG